MSSGKEIAISIVGIIIAIILSVVAIVVSLSIASALGVTGDLSRAAIVVAIAIIVGPAIGAFAGKRYFA